MCLTWSTNITSLLLVLLTNLLCNSLCIILGTASLHTQKYQAIPTRKTTWINIYILQKDFFKFTDWIMFAFWKTSCVYKCLKIFVTFFFSIYLHIVKCAWYTWITCLPLICVWSCDSFHGLQLNADPQMYAAFMCWWKTGTSGLSVNLCVIWNCDVFLNRWTSSSLQTIDSIQ